jgi:hypothetical protein|nr:MAG TPA: hypothetical protein [Caudoviricetes sp.]
MYRPAKNYHWIQQNHPEERKKFEEVAAQEAKARLKRKAELDGFKSEAEEKAWLLREGNLVGHLKWLTEAAADNYTQAQNPHIQSLTSFEFLVVHYMLEELLDEVIAEIAENFQ